MIKIIFCDWNKTLFEDAYDSEFFFGLIEKIGRQYLNSFNFKRYLRLTKTRSICRQLLERCLQLEPTDSKTRAELVRATVEIMNAGALNDIPMRIFEEYLDEYARKTVHRLDGRLLNVLTKIHQQLGVKLVILSSGCSPGIEKTLVRANFPFDTIMANTFERKGEMLSGFGVTVYGNKSTLLRDILRNSRIDAAETAFIGDDWEDRECFEIVGFPIVSFYASQRSKTLLADSCHAFVPQDEADLERLFISRCVPEPSIGV